MTRASGTVYRYGSDERITKASIKATKDDEVRYASTDDDGDFGFENLEPGQWTLVALHEESRPSAPTILDLAQDVTDVQVRLFRLQGTADQRSGIRFFIATLIALGALIVLYVTLHTGLPKGLAPASETFFWKQDPWRFLEVLLWGLAGILVNKIFISGWYLRSLRFYREGILMHVAHIVVTPLLVLVAVLLLSLVTLSLTLAGGSALTLDLSDPRILIAVSFVLGTIPWPLWGFIEKAGKRIAGQLD